MKKEQSSETLQKRKSKLVKISAIAIAITAIASAALFGSTGAWRSTASAAGSTTQTTSSGTTSTPSKPPIVSKPKPATNPVIQKPQTIPVLKPTAKPAIAPVRFRRNLSTRSRGNDVSYVQYKLTALGYLPGSINGRFTGHTRHAVIAFQKVNGLRRDGRVNSTTYAQLSKPKTVALRYPSGNHVEINKKLQVLVIVRNGAAKYIASTSTGKQGHTTPSVSSAVDWKAGARYESKKYHGTMIWPSFFYGGVAVHGYTSVPPYPASHGCCRIPIDDAKFIYNNMPRGLMVYVY